MSDKHFNVTVNLNSKCQLTTCNEDPDHHPAVVELDDKLVCHLEECGSTWNFPIKQCKFLRILE